MIQKAPFKFLDAYQQSDKEVFFGREKETNDLYDALSGVKHLLIYGPSGAGKTSLIECGLRNQFSDADWFALSIRRGDNINAAVFARINEALEEKIIINQKNQLPKDENIGFGYAIEQLFDERFQPVYLLFDQFEELLILGSDDEKQEFFTRLNQLIRYKIPCRIILIMREEFIGHLSEFEALCPSIFKHRFRLEKMRKEKVRTVIYDMLETEKYKDFYTVNNSKALADKILSKLPDKKREIELTHVQVFLSTLWDRAKIEQEKSSVHLPLLQPDLVTEDDDLEAVLNSFLKKQLKELNESYGKNNALEILAVMISERHTKLQLSEQAIQKDLQVNGVQLNQKVPNLLQDLKKRRLIRSQKSGRQTQYEISHDLLALAVGENLTEEIQMRKNAQEVYKVYANQNGYLSQDNLDAIRLYKPYKEYPKELENKIRKSEIYLKEKQEQKLKKAQERAKHEKELRGQAEINAQRAKQRTVIASIITFLAFVAAISAYYFFIKAEKQTVIAKQTTQEALKQTMIAERQTQRVLKQTEFAKQKQQEAETQKKLALVAKRLEEKERKKADSLRLKTEETLADLERQIDITNEKKKALQAEEKKRKEAEIQQKINLAKNYMNNDGYDLALEELMKVKKIAPNTEVKELIRICKSKLK